MTSLRDTPSRSRRGGASGLALSREIIAISQESAFVTKLDRIVKEAAAPL